MTRLLEEVSRDHFPYPPATPAEIAEFEQRVGWKLDPDLRAFYLHCNGAELIKRLPNSPYQILPLSEIVRARVAIYGEDDDVCLLEMKDFCAGSACGSWAPSQRPSPPALLPPATPKRAPVLPMLSVRPC